MYIWALQTVDYDDYPTGDISLYASEELAKEALKKRGEVIGSRRRVITPIKVEEGEKDVLMLMPRKDLNDIHNMISNYIEYWCGGGSEQNKEERKKWRPVVEKLWRAENGFDYTLAKDVV